MEEACYLVLKVSNNKQLLSVQECRTKDGAGLGCCWANRRFSGAEEYRGGGKTTKMGG